MSKSRENENYFIKYWKAKKIHINIEFKFEGIGEESIILNPFLFSKLRHLVDRIPLPSELGELEKETLYVHPIIPVENIEFLTPINLRHMMNFFEITESDSPLREKNLQRDNIIKNMTPNTRIQFLNQIVIIDYKEMVDYYFEYMGSYLFPQMSVKKIRNYFNIRMPNSDEPEDPELDPLSEKEEKLLENIIIVK